jgi:hypothetical protein
MFGDSDPLNGVFTNGRNRRLRVIGVVGDVRSSYSEPVRPLAYVMPGAAARSLSVVARVRDHRAATLADIKTALLTLGPALSPTAEWWSDQIATDPAYRDPKFQTIVFMALGTLALGLTALGIFSVVAYPGLRRTREMGVRLAIGATPRSLVVVGHSPRRCCPSASALPLGLGLAKWGGGSPRRSSSK